MLAHCDISAPSKHDSLVAPLSCQSAGARWYAVQCKPNKERTATQQLANQGIRSFLPVREKTRRHARRIERVRVPLFPGYLFVTAWIAISCIDPSNCMHFSVYSGLPMEMPH